MLKLTQVGGFVMAALIAGGAGASAQAAPAPGGAQAADKGAAVFVAQKCSLCHSLDGKGNAKGPLDSVGLRLSANELREWMVHPAEMTKKTKAERKPPMRAYPNLPKEDLDAIVAYMLSLKKK